MSKYKLRQYINFEGIKLSYKYIFKSFKDKNVINPNILVKSITDLNLNNLKIIHNIKYIVFDKDNTITLPHFNTVTDSNIAEKLKEFRILFGEKNLAIISNTAGSSDDVGYEEAYQVEMNTNIKVIRHQNKKPNVYNEILRTFDLEIESNNKEICVIGDRLLVDVVMGKEYGFYTVLVEPISREKENFVVKFIRKIEDYILYEHPSK